MKLLVVRAAGLTADHAVRGDLAANVSDLIADGSFAAVSGPADPSVPGAEVVDVPFTGMAEFDEALAPLRSRAEEAGAEMAIVSDGVFISQRFFPAIKPGAVLAPDEVVRCLASMSGA